MMKDRPKVISNSGTWPNLCTLRRQEAAAGAFAEGVNLVCARGRALGFAKRIGNRVNNMYPNTLRIIKR